MSEFSTLLPSGMRVILANGDVVAIPLAVEAASGTPAERAAAVTTYITDARAAEAAAQLQPTAPLAPED